MTLRDWNRSARVDSTRPSYTPEDKAKLKAKQKQLCRFSSRSSFAPYNVAISRFAILFIGFALEWNRCQPPPHAIVVVPADSSSPIEDHRASFFGLRYESVEANVRRDVSSPERHNKPKNAAN